MFSLARRPSPRVCNSLRRSFASVAPETPASPTNGVDWRTAKVPVREDHGLYGFFRRKANPTGEGEAAYETVESARRPLSGRAWRASELRLKNFQDLHTLWYITLRERNLLASQKEEARRMGIKINLQAQVGMAGACRKTMGRIKAIMNERRIAYEGALKLVEEQQETLQDKQLLRMQREALAKAQQKLLTFVTRGRMLRREKQRQLAEGQKALEQELALSANEAVTDSTSSTAAAANPVQPEPPTLAPSTTASPKKTPAASATTEAPLEPQTAAETATASLFGEIANRK
ncbi:mitochondrial 39-S ribosomal protein L47 (MRP-L47)-domain-containing protein [Coprinopsis sp. MPI-PUGE-AT-0042]|nr:mitochondrial 39-S ribosomal protein L47 (MRP-L47)-domain-containing protein [Coprinopsis sp. MPI-PUGE-AT-0042]